MINKLTITAVLVIAVGAFGYIYLGTPDSALSEKEYRQLLTVADIEEVLGTQKTFTEELNNIYEIGLQSFPEQVANVDSWFGTTFKNKESGNDISINVMDLQSKDFVDEQLQKLSGAFGIKKIETLAGEKTLGAEINEDALGSVIIFSQGDKVAVLQTSFLNGVNPLLTFEQTVTLAQRINKRLRE